MFHKKRFKIMKKTSFARKTLLAEAPYLYHDCFTSLYKKRCYILVVTKGREVKKPSIWPSYIMAIHIRLFISFLLDSEFYKIITEESHATSLHKS